MSTPKRPRRVTTCDEEEIVLLGCPSSKRNVRANETNLNVSSNSVEGIIVEDLQENILDKNDVSPACQTTEDADVKTGVTNISLTDEGSIILEHMQSSSPFDSNNGAQSVCSEEQTETRPWQQALSSIPARLKYIYEHREFTDCLVRAGEADMQKSFYVHKFMLFITSSKFKELASSGDNSELILPDITPSQFEILLRYIYLGVLSLKSTKDASDIYQIGRKYGIPHISLLAKAFAMRNLNTESIWTVAELAVTEEDGSMLEECCRFLSKNPLSWQHLTANISRKTIAKVLSQDGLDVPEIEVLKSVQDWSAKVCQQMAMEANHENRRKVVGSEIISKIRFLSLNPKEFCKFSFNPETDPDVPQSFLSTLETYAILANLNSPGCARLPPEFSMVPDERGLKKLRLKRKTDFSFVIGNAQFATSYTVPNCSAGSKHFATFLTTDQKIMLHGIQIPTYWDTPIKTGSHYKESYILEITDTENNTLAKALISADVNYASFVDILLAKAIVLEPYKPYKVSLSTENVYFLLKSFRREEFHENVNFSFKDCFTPANIADHLVSLTCSSHGFILQIIYSKMI